MSSHRVWKDVDSGPASQVIDDDFDDGVGCRGSGSGGGGGGGGGSDGEGGDSDDVDDNDDDDNDDDSVVVNLWP